MPFCVRCLKAQSVDSEGKTDPTSVQQQPEWCKNANIFALKKKTSKKERMKWIYEQKETHTENKQSKNPSYNTQHWRQPKIPAQWIETNLTECDIQVINSNQQSNFQIHSRFTLHYLIWVYLRMHETSASGSSGSIGLAAWRNCKNRASVRRKHNDDIQVVSINLDILMVYTYIYIINICVYNTYYIHRWTRGYNSVFRSVEICVVLLSNLMRIKKEHNILETMFFG